MSKKVWILNHYAMPPQYEVRIRNNKMAEFMQKKGYDVTLIGASTMHNSNINLIEGNQKYIKKQYGDLKFIHVKAPKYKGNGIRRIINMIIVPYRIFKYSNKFEEVPDVIINDLELMGFFFPFLLRNRYKCPVITEIRDLWPESIIEYGLLKRKSIIAKLLYYIEKRIYIKSDAIIFSMAGGKDYISEKKGWERKINMKKVYHINNGVDLREFDSNKEKYILEDHDLLDKDIFKVVYTGSIRLVNDIKMLVKTAEVMKQRQMKNVKILIYGTGDQREELIEYCKENSLDNIVFKGAVDKKYIPYILSNSDLNLIHVKQTNIMKYGCSFNKLFEYLASGKPILSDLVVSYDLIEEYGAGITIQKQSPEYLANAIQIVREMDSLTYNDMCRKARTVAEKYDFPNLTNELINIIEGIKQN